MTKTFKLSAAAALIFLAAGSAEARNPTPGPVRCIMPALAFSDGSPSSEAPKDCPGEILA